MDRSSVEGILHENGYDDFKWDSGSDIEVCQWPRFKCMFGCPSYGKNGAAKTVPVPRLGKNGACPPRLSRPCPEGLGVDVFAIVRKLGFPIEVLTDYEQTMNRYSFLMVE